ncbi:MDIS1-interacting receptor like kinase 2-like [Quercus lobata]|uniref:MDIS1-interacting receptor like kinase 2-like n=1 Tax=Quercus lobata TaxID=97700 RepID=UPI00124861A4|nr:MDIS1-interacting receptor like kinase 2-like [Quercus lobata]
MTSLSNKPLYNQFISSLVFFFLVVIILDFICSSTAFVSSVTSPFVYTNNKVKVVEERKEAKALLKWKTNLHSNSQSFLSSWAGNNPCNWVGINCDKSGSITHLNLSSHSLKGALHNLSFQSFPNLLNVDLSYNSLFGTIPSNIVRLSKLSILNLSYNQITGRIPSEIGKLTSLHVFYLAANCTIPASLGNLSSLTTLYLHMNQLSGSIPQELDMLSSLTYVQLSTNKLTGTIPASLGNLSSLTYLYLYINQLSSSIPEELGGLTSLSELDLSENNLTGRISPKLGDASQLHLLDLSSNKLYEEIPKELAKKILIGEIPQQFGELKVLEVLNLSHNALSGSIPSSFDGLLSLTSIDLSYNQLEGPMPNTKAFREAPEEAFSHNKGLCGNVTSLKACPSTISHNPHVKKMNKVMKLILVFLGILFLIFIFVGITLYFRSRKMKTEIKQEEEEHPNMFAVWSYDEKMVYEKIIEAIEDFDDKHIIGVGSHGIVYKAKLPRDQAAAVKKLHPLLEDSVANLKRLSPERYFLEGGRLEKKINNDDLALKFDWYKRVNVVKGVASALSYMHHDCSSPIIHRDISSKNVLLDSEYESHVSDFGKARIMSSNTSYWTSFSGTFGYSAPEVVPGKLNYLVKVEHNTDILLFREYIPMEVSEKCDVYSFGVVVLEVITGRHPGDLISSFLSSSFSLSSHDVLLEDILDQRLAHPTNRVAEKVVLVAKIAIACLQASPQSRPTMQ